MATTYQAIATVEVGASGASSIDFTSIPTDGTYTDLVIKLSARTTTAAVFDYLYATFNGSSASYSDRRIQANGATTDSYFNSNITVVYIGQSVAASATSSTFSNIEIYIPNYASSNNKSLSADSVTENNATTAYQWLSAGIWANSAAISSISLAGATFAQYTTATLYGIKNS